MWLKDLIVARVVKAWNYSHSPQFQLRPVTENRPSKDISSAINWRVKWRAHHENDHVTTAISVPSTLELSNRGIAKCVANWRWAQQFVLGCLGRLGSNVNWWPSGSFVIPLIPILPDLIKNWKYFENSLYQLYLNNPSHSCQHYLNVLVHYISYCGY